MNNINETKYRNTKFKLLIYVFIWILLCVCGYLSKLYLSTFTWYSWEPVYPFLHLLKENLAAIMLGIFALGIFIILWHDYRQMKNLVTKEREATLTLAAQSEQRKNDLVVYLAHDLKTPLTSVLGYLELLQKTPELPQETKLKYMQTAYAKAERLEDLLNEFFEITRYNLTHIILEKTKINMTRMLEQLIFEFQPMLQERNLSCKLTAEKDCPFFCDANRIQRVFDNLLKNAIHYSFSGSTITIDVILKEKEIVITFTNEGNTIPPEKLSHIFEQFYRLDNARRTKTGGAGVGLAIAREIVKLHEGTITAASENNQICFQVILPILSS